MKKDIENEADIRLLVDTFYNKVNEDELLSPIFNDVAQVAWEQHLPVMYSFWSSVLFGSTAYKGRPFPKHMRLPVKPQHFSRWVKLFEETVEELFSGDKAAEAKVRARNISQLFQIRMGFVDVINKPQES